MEHHGRVPPRKTDRRRHPCGGGRARCRGPGDPGRPRPAAAARGPAAPHRRHRRGHGRRARHRGRLDPHDRGRSPASPRTPSDRAWPAPGFSRPTAPSRGASPRPASNAPATTSRRVGTATAPTCPNHPSRCASAHGGPPEQKGHHHDRPEPHPPLLPARPQRLHAVDQGRHRGRLRRLHRRAARTVRRVPGHARAVRRHLRAGLCRPARRRGAPAQLHPRGTTALLDSIGRLVGDAGARLAALPEDAAGPASSSSAS